MENDETAYKYPEVGRARDRDAFIGTPPSASPKACVPDAGRRHPRPDAACPRPAARSGRKRRKAERARYAKGRAAGKLFGNAAPDVERTEWHRVVTFQNGLIDMLDKHAKKGQLVYVAGKMQTRKWRKDGEDSDRFSTEILPVPSGRIQFLDKPNGMNGNHAAEPEMATVTAAIPFRFSFGFWPPDSMQSLLSLHPTHL